jgi:hypothetical protein
MIISIIIGAIGRVTIGLKKNLEATPGKYSLPLPQNLFLEHHTQYGKYCSRKLEA